jgi:hypothetical protein
MKRVLPACFLLVLASCGEHGTNDMRTKDNDASSPIIISDGSIDMDHRRTGYFSIPDAHYPRTAQDAVPRQPNFISYQTCLSNVNACLASTCREGMVTPNCKLDIPATAPEWHLYLCEHDTPCDAQHQPTVVLTWVLRTPITIQSNDQPFDVPHGAHLSHKSNHNDDNHWMRSAGFSLTLADHTEHTYPFTCARRQACLAVHY